MEKKVATFLPKPVTKTTPSYAWVPFLYVRYCKLFKSTIINRLGFASQDRFWYVSHLYPRRIDIFRSIQNPISGILHSFVKLGFPFVLLVKIKILNLSDIYDFGDDGSFNSCILIWIMRKIQFFPFVLIEFSVWLVLRNICFFYI